MRLLRTPSGQILIAILLAVMLGIAAPGVAVQMRPLGDLFFRLTRLMIAPVIFTTVVLGVCNFGDPRRLGRIAAKTLIYFELVSTIAMLLGLALANLLRPGAGLHATQPEMTDAVAHMAAVAPHQGAVAMLLGIIPANAAEAFVNGDLMQILLVSVMVGVALSATRAQGVVALLAEGQTAVFAMIGAVMRLAPIGAFGALAAAVGSAGPAALGNLAALVGVFYAGVALFIFVVLGAITAAVGLSLPRILGLFREELLVGFTVASPEAVIARVLTKLEHAGVRADIAGFVLPAGYSFNQDGTALYMATALAFLAQATDHKLSLAQQFVFLAVMLLTSKGSTGVPGGSLVKLAATLQTSRTLPLGGLGLLIGVERPITHAISLTNVLGNIVAAFVIARWEGGFDEGRFRAVTAPRLRRPAASGAEFPVAA